MKSGRLNAIREVIKLPTTGEFSYLTPDLFISCLIFRSFNILKKNGQFIFDKLNNFPSLRLLLSYHILKMINLYFLHQAFA